MPRYRAQIGNLLAKGEEFTSYGNASRRDATVIKFRGRRFQLTRTEKTFALGYEHLREQRAHTHDLTIDDVKVDGLAAVRALVIELCELLGLATSSQVVFLGDDFQSAHFRPDSKGVATKWHPAITDEGQLHRFIDATWPRYHRLRRQRRLNEVLHISRMAGPEGTPIELRLLLAFWALESLKASYAQFVGHRYSRGKWRDVSPPPKAHLWNYPQLDFEVLIREMFGAVKLRRSLPAVIKMRNQIVHNGVSRLPSAEQERIQNYAHGLIREYLFRLLGYVGPYRDFEDAEVTITRLYPL